MSAYAVLCDALLACGAHPARIPGEQLPEATRRQMLVPVLRQHRSDDAVRLVAPTADAVTWAVACLSTSERQAKFHDAVLRVIAQGLHPSPSNISVEFRLQHGVRDLNGIETRWRTNLLLTLGWSPPKDGAGRWLPPGQVRRVKHQWRATDGFVLECAACGVAKWIERPRWQWAATRLDLSQRIAPVKDCTPRGAP